jgi:hypothetical protein
MSHLEEVVREERECVASFLRRTAKSYRDYASRLLSDTMQNRPDAAREEHAAAALENAAAQITEGRHWR